MERVMGIAPLRYHAGAGKSFYKADFLFPPVRFPSRLCSSQFMERVMGIEPTYPAWKAGTLPLSYTRMYGGSRGGIRTLE
jgi:hypothetical protein